MKRKGATDWGPIYMLVVIVIGAILVTTLLKPTLKQASNAAESNLGEAKQIASVGFFEPSLNKIINVIRIDMVEKNGPQRNIHS